MSSIGSRLTALVALVPDLSLRQLDALAGFRGSGLAQKLIANPSKRIGADVLAGYADALGVTLDYLAMGKGAAPSERATKRAIGAARERLGGDGHGGSVTPPVVARKSGRAHSAGSRRGRGGRAPQTSEAAR